MLDLDSEHPPFASCATPTCHLPYVFTIPLEWIEVIFREIEVVDYFLSVSALSLSAGSICGLGIVPGKVIMTVEELAIRGIVNVNI